MAKFEDAVRQPEAFAREACERFNLDPNKYPYEKVHNLPVIGSSTTRKQGLNWAEKTKSFNPIGRWKGWSPWRKRVFKRIAGQSLVQFGYCDSLDW